MCVQWNHDEGDGTPHPRKPPIATLKGHRMTTTAPETSTTPAVAEQPPVPALSVPIPVNAPGVAVLDGTAAEAAIGTLFALEQAIDALDAQRTTAKDTIKAEMGDRAIATLRGEPVVDWSWGSTTTVNGALLKAEDRSLWARVTRTTPRRPFNLKRNRSAA